jgi:tRNA threonylcarbamoyladenosine biosynthesis protein TsaB
VKVLGIDSATLTIGVAILDGDRVIAEARHDAKGRTNDLLVTIDRLCREAEVAPTALDAIAIGAGPGSFTGLRIGMATAKGIAFAAQRPLWAVSSLAALAHDAATQRAADGVIVSVLDARKGEVFAGCYDGDARPLSDERVLAPGAVADFVRGAVGDRLVSYAGDAITAYPDVFGSLADRWFVTTPSGVAVARLALAGSRVDVTTGGAPTYIRPSEAEVKYPDGVPGALKRKP